MENGNIEKAFYDLISELAETKPQCKNLTSGYIGNFEAWGDDRELCVWADGKVFWDCRAEKLDATAFNGLIQGLNARYNLEISGYTPEDTFAQDYQTDADPDPDCDSGPRI